MRRKSIAKTGSILLVMFLTVNSIWAQMSPCSIRVVADYNEWGWEAYVMTNGLIAVASVPAIGGRTMQYDLDGHPSIYVNPDELGKTYTPTARSSWHNYGGYKTWPAPQDRWIAGGGGWPPAPNLDFGAYTAQIVADVPESCGVHLRSPVETLERWNSRGLRLERRLTIYRSSTRVRAEQSIVNEGDESATWGVWDVTQSIVNHPGEEDWGNFWVYFPIKRGSRFGDAGFYTMVGRKDDAQWRPNLAEGISAVQYLRHSGKVGADSDRGWICHVDERDGYAYAKRFPCFEDASYPDNGAAVEVYTSDGLPYLEIEVLSPLADLPPGASYTFTEEWYAARTNGPILDVNPAGAIKTRLTVSVNGASASFQGEYGVFYVGTVQAMFKDRSGRELRTAATYAVSPIERFVVESISDVPSGARRLDLDLYDAAGKFVGVLDTEELEISTGIRPEDAQNGPERLGLLPNFPNPFNPDTTIPIRTPYVRDRFRLTIFSTSGQKIRTLIDGAAAASTVVWDGRDDAGHPVSSGIYVARLSLMGLDLEDTRKMALLR